MAFLYRVCTPTLSPRGALSLRCVCTPFSPCFPYLLFKYSSGSSLILFISLQNFPQVIQTIPIKRTILRERQFTVHSPNAPICNVSHRIRSVFIKHISRTCPSPWPGAGCFGIHNLITLSNSISHLSNPTSQIPKSMHFNLVVIQQMLVSIVIKQLYSTLSSNHITLTHNHTASWASNPSLCGGSIPTPLPLARGDWPFPNASAVPSIAP